MKKISLIMGIVLLTSPALADEPMTLEQAWVEAYQNNPSLEAQRAKLRATDEQVSQAESHWRPTVDATANVGKTYQYIPSQETYGTANFADTTRGYGVQLTQPIFRGFRTSAETEEAEKAVQAGRAQLQDAEQQLLLDTGTAFLDAARDETVVQIDHDNVDVLQKKLEETRVRAKVGDLTQTDVHQAESRLARAQVELLENENALVKDHDALARLTGGIMRGLEEPELVLDEGSAFDEALERAETQNPDVLAAQYTYEQAKAAIDDNKGSLLPELDLVGSSSRNQGQSSTLPGRFDSNQVLLQLTIPLYHAGSDYSQVRAAEETATQRRLELEEARHRAHESANNAWKSLDIAQSAIEADQQEIEAANQAYEGVRVEARVGTRTTLDVLNAEQELLNAKTDLVRAKHDKNLAVLQIKAAIGTLTAIALKLPLDAYDPERHYDDVHDKWFGFGDSDADIYSAKYKLPSD
jgi:TolC family type I secretion outer membrane protein